MDNPYYCALSSPTLAHFFDFSFAPALLFYAYIPIVLLSLFFGIYVFIKDHRSLQSTLLLSLAVSFVLWIANIIFQWIAVYAGVVYFSGALVSFFEVPIFLLAIYFVHVFLMKKDMALGAKVSLASVALVNLVLLPTKINIASFDLINCQVNVGIIWQYIYAAEIATIVYIIYFCLRKYKGAGDKGARSQVVYFMLAVVAFLSIFVASNIFGEITKVYSINLFGPIGMVIFLGIMTYMIVRFGMFNIKLFATQALVVGTAVLIGARLFYSTNATGFMLSVATLIAFMISGWFLIRSVRREIEQRELIGKQEQELEVVNHQQEGLLHFVSHEVKGYLTKNEAGFAAISDGDYGPVPAPLKSMAADALADTRKGVETVMDILDASNLKKGTVSYKKNNFDLGRSLEEIVTELQPVAAEHGLNLRLHKRVSSCSINGDEDKIRRHVLRNVIDNSLKYTPHGSVDVDIVQAGTIVRITVSDTGVGITPEDMKNLFTEGGHGADSIRINVHSTGYGLYIAKTIVEAHKGKIWAESEGAGKGSKFIIELPAL